MIYKDVIQKSDEWKELRYRKIGSTGSKDAMSNQGSPVEKNAIFFKLLGELTEDYEFEEPRFLSESVQRGDELEPIAREEFARIYGKQVFEIGWSESSDFTGISPDGIIGDEDLIDCNELNVDEALEIKCPARNTYALYLVDKSVAVEDYAWQIVTYFKEFPNLSILNLFIYRPENLIKSHILIELTRDMVIPVNKKKSCKIADLCIELTERQNELKEALKAKIEELKKPNETY